MNLDIEELARQAGVYLDGINTQIPLYVAKVDELERFAQLVAAAVKEECAKVCSAEKIDYGSTQDDSDAAYNMAVAHCVSAIRAMEVKT